MITKSHENQEQSSDFEFHYREDNSSLNLSRILACFAIATVFGALLWPASFMIMGAGWAILLLYTVQHIIYQKQRKDVLNGAVLGVPKALPQTTGLWSVAVSLVFYAVIYSFMRYASIGGGEWMRWAFLCVLAVISSCYLAWAVKNKSHQFSFLGFLSGVEVGIGFSSLLVFVFISLVSGASPLLVIASLISIMLLIHAGGILKGVLLRVDRNNSFTVFCVACLGALMTFVMGIGPELRGLALAIGERLACSADRAQQDLGYGLLQSIDGAPDIKALAIRAPGFEENLTIPTSIAPISMSDAAKVYYFLTNKSLTDSTDSDAKALPKLPGLSLVESTLTGHVDANSLTAVTYWTMIFNNQTGNAKEAEAFIGLPPNAVVSRVTLWVNGVPQEAAFNSTERVQTAYNWITQKHRDPLLVTEVAPGLLNLKASPVPAFGEMKVRIGITSGLDANSKRDFSFVAPKIINSNFLIEKELLTDVKLESNARLTSNAKMNLVSNSDAKNFVYATQFAPGSDGRFRFVAHRDSDFSGFSARATHSFEDMIISENLSGFIRKFEKLAIVIDSSSSVGKKRDEIKQALLAVPDTVDARVFLVDHRDQVQAYSVADAIRHLDSVSLSTGVDSMPALDSAKEFLGRSTNGAIAWIHDSKPLLFNEDRALAYKMMYSGAHRIQIYDFEIGAEGGANFLKTYTEKLSAQACPEFHTIAQNGSVTESLGTFFKGAGTKGVDLRVVRTKIPNNHLVQTSYEFPVASRMSSLWAGNEARKCAASGDLATAELLGNVYRVVTPATGAVVMERESDYTYQNLNRNFYSVVPKTAGAADAKSDGRSQGQFEAASIQSPISTDLMPLLSANPTRSQAMVPPRPVLNGITNTPQLLGATNGTIGPQGTDATSVTDGAAPPLIGASAHRVGPVDINGMPAPELAEANDSMPELPGASLGMLPSQTTVFSGWGDSVRNAHLFNDPDDPKAEWRELFVRILALLPGSFLSFRGFAMKTSKGAMVRNLVIGATMLMCGLAIQYTAIFAHILGR